MSKNKSRVLLVNPPFYRVMGNHYNGMSLGIAYIAANLNKHGHDAWVYNADFLPIDYYKTAHDLYLSFPNYTEIFKNTEHSIWTETVDSILKFNPDFVGFTSYTANVTAIQIISRKIMELAPNIKQVVGGVQPTLSPLGILEILPHVDYAVIREGEITMLSLVNGEECSSIPGLCYRKNGKIEINAAGPPIRPLDQLPYPERDKLWTHGGRPATLAEKMIIDVSYMISLRGCPYRCTFCASPAIWGRKNLGYRDPDALVNEMLFLKNNYWRNEHVDYGMLCSNNESKKNLLDKSLVIRDNTIVYFVDDVFTLKKKRIMELMKKMIDREINIPWKCESRADNIDQEIANMMADSGCKRVKIGFETGSKRMLKILKKDETIEEMKRGMDCLKKAGVQVTAYFMAGFPEEKDEDLYETIEFAKSLQADYYSLSILSPYYGTQIYQDIQNEGHIQLNKQPWEYFFHQSKKMLVNTNLSEKVLEEFWKLSDINSYI